MLKHLYASPAWSGFATEEYQHTIHSFLKKILENLLLLPLTNFFSIC